ncbi:protease inhibitor I42 family protein [Sphingomonas rhizophila]|uniref:Protease inhibitor I42 family protein n=1 Tax=Sphingomonas rhizophila TaxID=2071607 RepID=A0A7G9S9V1_9SPHN|nr:protease inhibitor I42 family protein [Sphingomonas rhizophila]QNN64626.1 protease inhibitor I42 family protein [Sphingomonas rhizophila]
MNLEVRRARLKGTREAERILQILDARPRLFETRERVDVFDALAWLDVRVLFKPLQGLLGAYIRGVQPGALISTQRPQSVQRFTAAHELGHAILNHEPSLDSPEVLRRAAFNLSAPKRGGFASYLQEIEADAFAGAFLLPTWLIAHHARKQEWSRSDLGKAEVAYQLALRCGTSFQATVWALERHKIIGSDDRTRLLNVKPKKLKADLKHEPPVADTRADAWNLSQADAASDLAVTIGDTVTISLEQKAGAGFLWELAKQASQLAQIEDGTALEIDLVGGPSVRSFLFKACESGTAQLVFDHLRPWENEPIERASYSITVFEPEQGLSRANRARLIKQSRGIRGLDAH